MNTRILLADDHAIVRQGVRSLEERRPSMEVIGEAGDGREAVRMAEDLAPHIVVMDIGMPVMNGIEATHQITSRLQDIKVIALSVRSDRHYIVEMLRAGSLGYLPKASAFEELVDAFESVISNRLYLSPRIVEQIVGDYLRKEDEQRLVSSAFSVLTSREREVLQLLAEGKSVREISEALFVSIATVNTHRHHVMTKLGLSSMAELIRYAIRQGLVSSED